MAGVNPGADVGAVVVFSVRNGGVKLNLGVREPARPNLDFEILPDGVGRWGLALDKPLANLRSSLESSCSALLEGEGGDKVKLDNATGTASAASWEKAVGVGVTGAWSEADLASLALPIECLLLLLLLLQSVLTGDV